MIDCDVIGGNCYSDGSSLYAMEVVFPDFMKRGEEAVWYHLEDLYKSRFNAPEIPMED